MEDVPEKLSLASQLISKNQKAQRDRLFLKGPIPLSWLREVVPDPTSRLILIAKAFADMQRGKTVKLTRRVWEAAAIFDKDTKSRVISKLRNETALIEVDSQQGRCSIITFK